MDVKDLRSETALSEHNDGSKYTQGGVALQCNRNKSYHDIGSNPLAKSDSTPVRPCAVIGPDRVVPPTASNDPYLKKGPVEPWPSPDNVYRRPPEYPHKLLNQNPSRNISPRQTFQENMQRIMVPPTYNATRQSDDANFSHIQDRNVATSKNVKINMAPEAKYCDVPYAINMLANEPKNIRDTEMYVPSVNSPLTRTASHVWPPGSVNMHASRTYGAHELYQYPQYPSCAGPRPTVIPMNRPHRTIQEDAAYVYPDHYYQDTSARFKPYPPMKERYPQPRYEYIGNYPSQFHPPPPIQPHKYDVSKSGSSHPYSVYPHLKYLENRVPDHTLEGYQRPTTNQQPHYNLQFRNQVIHPTYVPVPGNSSQNKLHPYPIDGSVKGIASNKLHYDNSNKVYIDYENARTKTYPMADNCFVNEIGRVHPVKNQVVMPNYSSIGMHSIPSQQYYRKDNSQMKPFEYMPHFRNFEPQLNNSAMLRHAPQFSPNPLAMSPSDSSISNDISQTHGTSQEDCGYVSQSSTTSVRSIESGMYRLPHEYYKRYDFRYGPLVGNSHTLTKADVNLNNVNSKDNKQKEIDVRQFFQMWNEGEEENNCENANSKEIVIQTGSSDTSTLPKQHLSNQDQLYVLGLVNVPSEELSKYEHIQKISKLPENIKGYNSLELLSQFEEAIESSKTPSFKSIPKEYQIPSKDNTIKQVVEALPRPLSPLDVESKISQSVIHKEVGCNFEIRPCSPKMLNVEVAAPAQNVLGERVIEKVTNPLSKIVKSPMPVKPDENSNCHTIKRQDSTFAINDNPSCKMIRSPYASNNMDSVKTNYSLQDLEINSGVCLASLPRLDNEIELNFPEVNQQFINDNKKDGDSTTKNFSRINSVEESGLTDNKLLKLDLDKNDVQVDKLDKTFTKLSKYRKLKSNAADHSGNNQLPKAIRTDSVIIKNPENIKNIEDKLLENNLNVPINLSSQSSVYNDLPDKPSKNHDDDTALDFSLNKSGNDLPIIETEKEELTKSFTTHLSLTPCANVSLKDSNESRNKSTNFDNQILNQKDTDFKCIKTEHNTKICVENNQGKELKKDAKTIINEVTSTSVVQNSINDALDSDNLIFVNTAPVNKHLNINVDIEQVVNNYENEISETCEDNECVDSKKYVTDGDTTSIDNICNESNPAEGLENLNNPNIILPTTGTVSNCQESAHFLCPANKVSTKLNKLVLTSHNDDDFEHDEISANLEKLFQESNVDTAVSNSDNDCLDISVSMPLKILFSKQSKELHSPWIQKLLTHSEGLCSNIGNKRIKKESMKKTISNGVGSINKPVQINIFNEEQSQNMDIDHKNGTMALSHLTTPNEIFITNMTEETVTSDAKCAMESESFSPYCQPDAVTDTIKNTYADFSRHETKTHCLKILPEEDVLLNAKESCFEKSSCEWNADENCKIDPELEIETRKNDIDNSEPNTLRDSETINEILNREPVHSSAESIDNEIKATDCDAFIDETCEILNNKNKNITKKDSNVPRFENESRLVSNNTKYQIKEYLRQNSSIENVMINHDSDSEILFDDSNVVHENYRTFQKTVNKHNLESVTDNVSVTCTEYHIKDNQSTENTLENVINDRDNDTDETFDSSNVEQKDQNNLGPESSSNSVSDNYDGYKIKEPQSQERIVTNAVIEIYDNDTCKTSTNIEIINIDQEDNNNPCLESSSSNVINNCAGLQTKENHSNEGIVDTYVNKNHDNDKIETSKIFKNSNIIQKDNNHLSSENLSNNISDDCGGHQTKVNQDAKQIVADDIMNQHNDIAEISETLNNSNIVHENHNNNGIDGLSNNISYNCAGYQTEKDQNDEILEENNVIENRDDCAEQPLETFESCNNICKVDKIVLNNPTESLKIQNNVIDSCNEHHKNENLSGEDSGNAINDYDKDTGETSKALNNSNIFFKDEIVQVVQNNLFNSMSDINNCTEHQKKEIEIESELSLIEKVTKESDNTSKTSEPYFNKSNNFQVVQNQTNFENLSKNVSKICTEHQTNEKQGEEKLIENNVTKNCDDDASKTSEIWDGTDSVSKLNDIVQEDQHNFGSGNLSKANFDSCIDLIDDNESAESLTENVIKNRDSSVTSETFGSSYFDRELTNETRENLINDNTNSSSNSVFLNYSKNKTEDNQRECNDTEMNKIALNYTNSDIGMPSEKRGPRKNDCEPHSLVQENMSNNSLENLPYSIFNKSTERQIKENASLNETTTVTDDMYVKCDSNKENIRYEEVIKDENQLENSASNLNNPENSIQGSPVKRRLPLKRSLSDSALNDYKNKDASDRQVVENTPVIWPSKRPRMYDFENSEEVNVIDENLCRFIQNNRRNSVSSFYNGENVSFCILIDNDCIITEENEEEKICFAEISEDCITEINTVNEEDNDSDIICCSQNNELNFSDSVILDYGNEKSIQESWLDNVACVETVVSDDIEEDVVICAHDSPRDVVVSEYDESGHFNSNLSEFTNETNFINEQTILGNVCQIEETNRSPHVDIGRIIYSKEPQGTELCNDLYSGECFEKIILESTSRECPPSPIRITQTDYTESILLPNSKIPEDKENIFLEKITLQSYEDYSDQNRENDENHMMSVVINQTGTSENIANDGVQSSESSVDNVFSYKKDEDVNYTTSSSPEVSSTTSEEKSSSILLKITNYNGSRVSEVNEVNRNRPRCKFTEDKEYSNSNGFPKRPLLTKAAQKYIPPLKESIRDLKVKLPLPQQKLLKLKQLKLSISEPKVMKQNNHSLTIPKKSKPKPNFEDVLKNIDEVQIKMHKEKSKKGKNIIPKVVIKKNLNGSHYTSSSNKDTFNPDLTGRKWQPWVFLEKNHFIDTMAIRNKTKAIFSHRKNTYVLAEKFKKYKSVSNCSAKFIISQPKTGDSSRGHLKYTIRLKHTY